MAVSITAAMLAYPIDTVRRLLMMQSGALEKRYVTSLQAMRHVLRHDGGVLGLYKGAGANNMRAVASALVLVFFDEARRFVPE